MDVDKNTSVGALVGAREANGRRASGTTAGNRDLVASHVQLRASRTASRMKGNDLRTEEIVARGDVRGDLNLHLAAARVEVLDAPEVVVTGGAGGVLGPGVLEDLEPAGGTVGGGGVGDLGHVHEDGTVVGAADGFRGARAVVGLLVMC